jgi:hypothetical protein
MSNIIHKRLLSYRVSAKSTITFLSKNVLHSAQYIEIRNNIFLIFMNRRFLFPECSASFPVTKLVSFSAIFLNFAAQKGEKRAIDGPPWLRRGDEQLRKLDKENYHQYML